MTGQKIYFNKVDNTGWLDKPAGITCAGGIHYYTVDSDVSFPDAVEAINEIIDRYKDEKIKTTLPYPDNFGTLIADDFQETEDDSTVNELELLNRLLMLIKELFARNCPPIIEEKLFNDVNGVLNLELYGDSTADSYLPNLKKLQENLNAAVAIYHRENESFAQVLIDYGEVLIASSTKHQGSIERILYNIADKNTEEKNTCATAYTPKKNGLMNKDLKKTFIDLLAKGKEIYPTLKTEQAKLEHLQAAQTVIEHHNRWMKKVLSSTEVSDFKVQAEKHLSWWTKTRYSFANSWRDFAVKRLGYNDKVLKSAKHVLGELYCQAYDLKNKQGLSEENLKSLSEKIAEKTTKLIKP